MFTYANTEADAREREGVCGDAGGLRGGSEGGRGAGVEGGRGGGSEGGRGGGLEEPTRGASEEPHVENDVHVESVLLQLDEEGDFVSDVLER